MPFHSRTFVPVYRTAEIRDIESKALAGVKPPGLMERAGLAAAEIARNLTADGGRVLVLAGPGNNGGDAFVVARHLKSWWYKVLVVFTGDAAKLSTEAKAAFDAWRGANGTTDAALPAGERWDLIVDGLFGIGLQRDLSGSHARLVTTINCSDSPVLALDIPSGLDADTGRVLGCAVRARHTVTFIGLKPGLLTLDGPDYCGELHVCRLDLDAPALLRPAGAVIGSDIVSSALPKRRANSHKGDYGSVGVIGGASGMVGAALLAGRGAINLGTGRVYLGLLDAHHPAIDMGQPELMVRTADEVLKLDHLDCLAVGPGLGQTPDAHYVLSQVVRRDRPLVIDADALNLIAADGALQNLLKTRNSAAVLTPHPAEASRLLDCKTAEIQADRVAAANKLATRYHASVVLKGAGSVCALPDGKWFINTSGNPGMASAGTGDVLTGIIAALMAQGVSAEQALLCGVYLHGAAGDKLVADGKGPVGMTAGEVISAARALLNVSL